MSAYKKNTERSYFIVNELYFVQIRNTKDTDKKQEIIFWLRFANPGGNSKGNINW